MIFVASMVEDHSRGIESVKISPEKTQIQVKLCKFHRENAGTLGMVPYLFNPPRSPLKVDIPNKYPQYKVYMGFIIRGTIPRVPAFSLWTFKPHQYDFPRTILIGSMVIGISIPTMDGWCWW